MTTDMLTVMAIVMTMVLWEIEVMQTVMMIPRMKDQMLNDLTVMETLDLRTRR